ncbi:MAG: dipeptidase [Dermatophilaceae bacterium]|jgi:acetylornithine deacetylase/succinyl-diaminopimelate desuccinylase-like protein|nr:dipeptidase [Dermatophilaceae bacterium]MBP9917195.1 dipeptidase [Dermatophilaceae bacterium]
MPSGQLPAEVASLAPVTDHTVTPDHVAAIRARVRELLPQLRHDLEELSRIPSVSLETLDGYDQAHVDRSAEQVAALLRAEGLTVEIVREGGQPAVIGHIAGPSGAPTVMLYAHHDVQPPGDPAGWDSDPWEPTERDGRLYGRGVADDKAGVLAHLAALRVHAGALPVNVTVFVEGEEEVGSESLPTILERHGDKLRADAIVLADSGNWEIGQPALTTTLRGLVRAVVTVSVLDHGVHSGMFGGPLPDALTTLCRLLATLHDADGNVAVPDLVSGTVDELDYDEARLRAESGVLDGVQLIGSGSILERLWAKPALSVIGINAPTVEDASNTLIPVASAKVSMRVAPHEDPDRAFELLRDYLLAQDVWGATVTVTKTDTGPGFSAKTDGPIYDEARAALADAWDGTEPVEMGVGGSIPFVAAFAARFPDAAILVTGVEDPDTRAHGTNESLHLDEWERACVAEAVLFARLGAMHR